MTQHDSRQLGEGSQKSRSQQVEVKVGGLAETSRQQTNGSK